MRLVIVTGMSGAGKTTALKILEDMGYYCVDNLPVPLIPDFLKMYPETENQTALVALGIDIRSGQMLSELQQVLEQLSLAHILYEILYLDASDACLVKRFKETRRAHPLSPDRVEEGIERERKELAFLRRQADYLINTGQLLTRELRASLEDIFQRGDVYKNLYISVVSFGFKYGVPLDADLVFDVRFLPNPFYNEELRELTGNDEAVREYVLGYEVSQTFLKKLYDMLTFLIPNYISEGKTQLVVGIGCTGGKHRSVVMVNVIHELLKQDKQFGIRIEHRDIVKDKA